MMNVMALNFLQHNPGENWLDYFIDYNKFLELLHQGTDRALIEQLFDQFVDHALSCVSEAKNSKRKRMCPEDVEFAEQKADKLWLFGWACAARLGWNLDALLKCSNVVRVFSMVSRLFEHTFNVKGESDILSYLSRNGDEIFDSRTSFVTWLYARLVLIIDMQARAPAPPQKPTVSNPNNQIDPALFEAEKISTFIVNVRKHVRNAAAHMERLLSLKFHKIEIPTFYCFEQTDNQNRNPSTSKNRNYIEVDVTSFVVRTKCDLLLAHFAATHFSTARKLLNEIEPEFGVLSTVDKSLYDLFAFDLKKFNGYKVALANKSKTQNKKLRISPYEFNTQRSNELSTARFSTNENLEKATKLYKTAKVVKLTSKFYAAPNSKQIVEYTGTGPPLWQMFNSFDYESVLSHYSLFCEWDPTERGFPNRIATGPFSPLFAKMLEENPIDGEPLLFYLSQLEKMINNWEATNWKRLIEGFLSRMLQPNHKWNKYTYSICYEVLRMNEKIYISSFGYEKNSKVLKSLLEETEKFAKESVTNKNQKTSWSLRLTEQTYYVSLLNLGLFVDVVNFLRNNPDVSSQYLNFARIVATLLSLERNDEVQWKYLTPLLHHMNSNSEITLSKEKFVEVVRLLINVKVCEYILSFFVSLFNKCANIGERQQYPYTKNMKTKNLTICYVNRTMFNPNPVDVPAIFSNNAESVDIDFVCQVIGILLQNALLSANNNLKLLCQFADFCYVQARYKEAARLYTTILNLFEQGFCDMSDYDKIVTDLTITKLVHCFYELKMYTLSVVTGQLLRDVRTHLYYVAPILKLTPQTADAGRAYFPYIYSIPIFEAMSEVYERNEMNVYYISILKMCPTKALTQGNSADVIREETLQRRSQFIEIAYKTMQNHSKKLELLSEQIQLTTGDGAC